MQHSHGINDCYLSKPVTVSSLPMFVLFLLFLSFWRTPQWGGARGPERGHGGWIGGRRGAVVQRQREEHDDGGH